MKVWAVIVAIEDYPNVIGGVAQKLPGTNDAAADVSGLGDESKKCAACEYYFVRGARMCLAH